LNDDIILDARGLRKRKGEPYKVMRKRAQVRLPITFSAGTTSVIGLLHLFHVRPCTLKHPDYTEEHEQILSFFTC
jgi:hypothetical protein